MKISVVTVCLNSEKTLERTLQSVLSQTYRDLELIVVDGQSTDATPQILRRYRDRISRLVEEKDAGIYDAMNKGWRLASGDFVHFLHSDDWYADSRAVERFAAAMEKVRESSPGMPWSERMWHGKLLFHHDDGRLENFGRPVLSGDLRFKLQAIHQPATLFPRRAIVESGGHDLQYRVAADYELIRRLARDNPPIFVDETLVCMSGGGTSARFALTASRENIRIALRFGENRLAVYVENRYVFNLWLKERFPALYRVWEPVYRFLRRIVGKRS